MNAAAICYLTFGEKRAKYPSVVIPLLYQLAAEGAHSPAVLAFLESERITANPAGHYETRRGFVFNWQLLEHLHEAIRARPYIRKGVPCDAPLIIPATLEQGGDCEDWAVVIGAVLNTWGATWRFVTAGDDTDPHRHIWVQALALSGDGYPHWYNLDCKGSQAGLGFNESIGPAKYPVRRAWQIVRTG